MNLEKGDSSKIKLPVEKQMAIALGLFEVGETKLIKAQGLEDGLKALIQSGDLERAEKIYHDKSSFWKLKRVK